MPADVLVVAVAVAVGVVADVSKFNVRLVLYRKGNVRPR